MIRRLCTMGLVVACAHGAVRAETFESVEKKLTEMRRKITSLSEKVRYHQFLEGAAKNTTTGEGSIEFMIVGDKYFYREELNRVKKIEYQGQASNEPNTFQKICDGQFTWLLNINLNQPAVTKQKLSPPPDPNPFLEYKKQYDMALLKDEDVSGRPCWVVEVKPKPPQKHPWPAFPMRFWFDKDLGVALKKVTYDIKGRPMTTLTYMDIRTNVPLKEDRFRFEAPPNSKIFDDTTATTETMTAPPEGK